MKIGYIFHFILVLTLLSLAKTDTQGTESYFLSPHDLGKCPEVDMALNKISGQIRVQRTTYDQSGITYILDNVSIDTAYNNVNQTIEIRKDCSIKVTGGRIKFTYRFNYTKIYDNIKIDGYGQGSVLSDPLTYSKHQTFCDAFLCWRLTKGGIENLTLIENRMSISKLEPFKQSDLLNIENMLDKDSSLIYPANLKVQILNVFNQIFPLALNNSLNQEIFGQKVTYTYDSNTHGLLKMNIIRDLYAFDLQPESGYKIVFVTEIQSWPERICNQTVPLKPFSFEKYGGSQSFLHTCVYEGVVSYMQSNGWLDTVLDNRWESDSFHFYAGDLFDLIGNLYLNFSPGAVLDGKCIAQEKGLRFFASKEFEDNSYTLDVTYSCSLKGTNKRGSNVEIMRFKSVNKIYIKAGATTETLTFKIISGDITNLSFEPVGSYVVSNTELAMVKAKSIMKGLEDIYTFGTGFPTLTRDLPKTVVEKDYVFYYDSSHSSQANLRDS